MAKFLNRIGADKVTCVIEMELTNLRVICSDPMTMFIAWTRGPQRDESSKFDVSPDQTDYKLKDSFKRESHFYREKDGSFQKKTCGIDLVFLSGDRKVNVGFIEIDLGTMVGKGKTTLTLDLQNVMIIQSAKITASFCVTEGGVDPMKELESMKQILTEKHEESAKYAAMAAKTGEMKKQIEDLENQLLAERQAVARTRQELLRVEGQNKDVGESRERESQMRKQRIEESQKKLQELQEANKAKQDEIAPLQERVEAEDKEI